MRAADPKTRCEVTEVLDGAVALGVTVVRAWAFSDGPSQWNAFRRCAGGPKLFLRILYFFYAARSPGLKLKHFTLNMHYGLHACSCSVAG